MIIKPSDTIAEKYGIDVLHALHSVEQRHKVRIVYACVVGSRAHGTDNRSTGRSDWDVRFVFVNNPDAYVSINSKTNTVSENNPETLTGTSKLDLFGWEMGVFLNAIKLSKANQCETMYTPIVIPEFTDLDMITLLKDMTVKCLNPGTLIYSMYGMLRHYESMHVNKGNNGSSSVYKRLINMQRLYLMASFITDYASSGHVEHPPVNMAECLSHQPTAIAEDDLAWVMVGRGTHAIDAETAFIDKYVPNVEKWCKFVKSRDDLVPKLPADSEFDAIYRGSVFAPSLKYGPEREAMFKMFEERASKEGEQK